MQGVGCRLQCGGCRVLAHLIRHKDEALLLAEFDQRNHVRLPQGVRPKVNLPHAINFYDRGYHRAYGFRVEGSGLVGVIIGHMKGVIIGQMP